MGPTAPTSRDAAGNSAASTQPSRPRNPSADHSVSTLDGRPETPSRRVEPRPAVPRPPQVSHDRAAFARRPSAAVVSMGAPRFKTRRRRPARCCWAARSRGRRSQSLVVRGRAADSSRALRRLPRPQDWAQTSGDEPRSGLAQPGAHECTALMGMWRGAFDRRGTRPGDLFRSGQSGRDRAAVGRGRNAPSMARPPRRSDRGGLAEVVLIGGAIIHRQ
jgi:hypothetical protein